MKKTYYPIFFITCLVGYPFFLQAQVPSYVSTISPEAWYSLVSNAVDSSCNGVCGATPAVERFGHRHYVYGFNNGGI